MKNIVAKLLALVATSSLAVSAFASPLSDQLAKIEGGPGLANLVIPKTICDSQAGSLVLAGLHGEVLEWTCRNGEGVVAAGSINAETGSVEHRIAHQEQADYRSQLASICQDAKGKLEKQDASKSVCHTQSGIEFYVVIESGTLLIAQKNQ